MTATAIKAGVVALALVVGGCWSEQVCLQVCLDNGFAGMSAYDWRPWGSPPPCVCVAAPDTTEPSR